MLVLRKSQDRGFANHGWLQSWHSFSFADYFDHRHMGFRQLRVINQDIVAPGKGFPMHGHTNMEIITVVLRGTIAHQDSMGNKEKIRFGEIQRMSAGTGVRHSEFNPSTEEELELLQIWIEPSEKGIPPSYEQASYEIQEGEKLRLIVAPIQEAAPVHIHQNARISRGSLKAGENLHISLDVNRYGWLQMISGSIILSGFNLGPGDALAISREEVLSIQSHAENTSFLFFDLG